MGRPTTKKENPEKEGMVNPAAPEETTQMNQNMTNPDSASATQETVTNTNQLNDDTTIEVKALVPKVYYTCPVTRDPFAWEEVGDTQDMTFKQLKMMKAKHSRYLTEKWLMPQSDAVIKKLGLDKIYSVKLTIAEKTKIRGNDVDAVAELLSKLNNEGKAELAQYAIKSTEEGKILNIKIIRMLESQLGVELMQLI